MAHFKIENLSFSYPCNNGISANEGEISFRETKALDNINLEINAGEYLVLCGKSGSGKTTLMRHLKTVLTPFGKREGCVYFEGAPLDEISQKRQSMDIGYVMQNPDQQIVTDKVWHELAFGPESLGMDQKTMRLKVAEMANYFGIQTWFHKNVADLSGGQKQLLNLASIMVTQPNVLILDEPTSQLDPIAASDFLNTIRKINLDLGTTIIISEHRLEDVFPAADRVVMMENGRITMDDAPDKIGRLLHDTQSDMVHAMPAPMRIYYSSDSSLDCPLTVREGRKWLDDELKINTNSNNTDTSLSNAHPDEEADEYTEPDEPAVELKEIWFRYEKNSPDILKGASLKVDKASFHAVVGGNGTGKSTMLRTVCGILKPYRGKVLINGKRLDKYKGTELYNNCLVMLPQDPQSLFVKKTVREDLEEILRAGSLSKEEKEKAIMEVAEECHIVRLLDSHPYDLSGGEQQRAALAKVLLCNPQILLLDEPTKGIDNFFKIKLAELLNRLIERGITIIMVSHDIEFCAKYADTVSMFFDGDIVTTNTTKKFFSQNNFYTTAANRMSRHIFPTAITDDDVVCGIKSIKNNKEGCSLND